MDAMTNQFEKQKPDALTRSVGLVCFQIAYEDDDGRRDNTATAT